AKEPLHRVKPRAPVAGPLEFPSMVRADSKRIVVSDAGHHRVLVLDHAGNVLETIGSGLRGMREGSFAECVLDEPQGLALDGDTLFIADARAHVIWQADLQARVLN